MGDARIPGASRGRPAAFRFCRARWRRCLTAVLVVATGVAGSVGSARWVHLQDVREAEAALAEDGRLFVESIQTASAQLQTRMAAVAGLLRASDHVTAEEFEGFTADIGLLPGMGGYGFAPLVSEEDFDRWQSSVTKVDPDYASFGIAADGGRVPRISGQLHAPLLYFAPHDAFGVPPQGLDLMSEPVRAAALGRAMRTGSMAVTPFLHLLGETDSDGLVAFLPVAAADGTAMGFVTAPVDLSLLFSATIPEPLVASLLWQVTDLQDHQSVGLLDVDAQPAWTGAVLVGDRGWLLEVRPRQPLLPNGPIALPWVTLPAAIIGSLLAGLLVLLSASALDARRQRIELQGVIKAKDRFLATISHQLRTPLTGVVGFLREALYRSEISDAEKRELLGLAAGQADEMAAIVEDLVTATKASTSELTTDVEVTNVSHQVAHVLRAFPQRVALRLGSAKGPMLAWVDPYRLRQILRNLLNNAARHGEPPIELSIATGPEHVVIHVSDHGSGVPAERQHLLFRPYQPLTPSSGQPHPLGLGLWISRLLAMRMGGSLTYRADPLPTFTLTLLAAPASLPTQDLAVGSAASPAAVGG